MPGPLIETYLSMMMLYRWRSAARLSSMCLINVYSMISLWMCLHFLIFGKDAGGGEGHHLIRDLFLARPPVIPEVSLRYQDPFLPVKIVVPERSTVRATRHVVDHHQSHELVFARLTNISSSHLPQDEKQQMFLNPSVISRSRKLLSVLDVDLKTVTTH